MFQNRFLNHFYDLVFSQELNIYAMKMSRGRFGVILVTGRPLEIEILCRLHNYFAFEPSCFADKKCQHSTLVNPHAVGRDS